MKNNERKIFLKRYFTIDKELYKLGKVANLNWFDKFDYKFKKDQYAFFANEEKEEAFHEFFYKIFYKCIFAV